MGIRKERYDLHATRAAVTVWVDTHNLAIGDTHHINHASCGDTRGRLYITHVVGGKYLFYCHNCGEGGQTYRSGAGAVRMSELYKYDDDAQSRVTQQLWSSTDEEPQLRVLNPMYTASHDETVLFLGAMGCKVSTFGWLPIIERPDVVRMSFSHAYGSPGMYSWLEDQHGNRYMYETTFLIDGKKFRRRYLRENPVGEEWPHSRVDVLPSTVPGGNLFVVVEDKLSQAFGSQCVPHMNWVCLYGKSMAIGDMVNMARVATHIVLWLDPDVAGTTASRELMYKLYMMKRPETSVCSVMGVAEPRKLEHAEVCAIICNQLGIKP